MTCARILPNGTIICDGKDIIFPGHPSLPVTLLTQVSCRTVGSAGLSLAYDTPTLKSANDPTMSKISKFTHHLVRAGYIDSHLVEFFPWIQYLPSWLMSWKQEAEYCSVQYSQLFQELYGTVKTRVVTFHTFNVMVGLKILIRNYSSTEIPGQAFLHPWCKNR